MMIFLDMSLHFKVAEEYNAQSGETLSKNQVRNRWTNNVVKYASRAQSLGLRSLCQESVVTVPKMHDEADDPNIVTNPWCVPVWEDFLHFVCPECNLIEKDKATFIKHAFDQHPRVSEVSNADEEMDIKIECDSPVDNAMDQLEYVENEVEIKPTEIEIQHDMPLVDNAIEQPEGATNLKMKAQIISMGDNSKEESVQGAKCIKCVLCQEELSSKRNLLDHMKTIHGTEKLPKRVNCKICNKLFKRAYLSNHMKTVHEGVKDYCCELCGKSYTNPSTLLSHKKTQHEKKREFQCTKCEKNYDTKRLLKQHFDAIHLGLHRQCPECGKVFLYKHALNKHHRVVHLQIKDFPCGQCDKAFFYLHNWRDHVRNVHEGKMDPDAKCGICNKQFSHKHHVQRHINIVHKKLRPHKCDDCGEAFDRKLYLRNHQNKAHGKQD